MTLMGPAYNEMTVALKAESFARVAHYQQTRRTGEPYIYHLQEVVTILKKYTDDEEILAAGWLHDFFEDQSTPGNMAKFWSLDFPDRVVNLMNEVTNHDQYKPGSSANFAAKILYASPDARLIKYADMMSNIPSMSNNDPGYGPIYAKKKLVLLNDIGRTHYAMQPNALYRKAYNDAWSVAATYSSILND